MTFSCSDRIWRPDKCSKCQHVSNWVPLAKSWPLRIVVSLIAKTEIYTVRFYLILLTFSPFQLLWLPWLQGTEPAADAHCPAATGPTSTATGGSRQLTFWRLSSLQERCIGEQNVNYAFLQVWLSQDYWLLQDNIQSKYPISCWSTVKCVWRPVLDAWSHVV